MPSSEYTNTIGGGLKLKGSGVDKKKRKKKSKGAAEQADESKAVVKKDDGDESAAQKALADEEGGDAGEDVVKQAESDTKAYGKTEAQRRHEERRRKRVSSYPAKTSLSSCIAWRLTYCGIAGRTPQA